MTIIINAVNTKIKAKRSFYPLDDLSYRNLGINGCKVPEISPHMDRIASSGLRFERFHVQASNCIPSRALMMTGMYQQKIKFFL